MTAPATNIAKLDWQGGNMTTVRKISDDDILTLWRTVRPSGKQDAAMVYQTGPYDVDRPTYELRRLVELAMWYGRNKPEAATTDAKETP